MSDALPRAFDVFISYSHHDSDWVDGELVRRLDDAGLRVCIDTRDFELGVPSLVNIERAVDASRHVFVVLTPAWVASEWAEFESLLAGTADPAARRRKIIPLMLQDCTPPARIAMLTWADFRNPAQHDAQFKRLISQLQRSAGLPSTTPMPSRPTPADPTPPATAQDRPSTVINTGGGAYIAGNVTTGGDFVGRDKIVGEASPRRADDAQRGSWQRQLDNYRNSLRLLEDRMAEYVLTSEVPLQLIREKERLLAKIEELERKLGG